MATILQSRRDTNGPWLTRNAYSASQPVTDGKGEPVDQKAYEKHVTMIKGQIRDWLGVEPNTQFRIFNTETQREVH